MSTAKSKPSSKVMTKLEICEALSKVLPVGDSCTLQTDSMVVLAFHLRDVGDRKVITTAAGVKHDITEYCQGISFRGIQRVVDGELIDIGTPKSGKFDMRMSVYHGQA